MLAMRRGSLYALYIDEQNLLVSHSHNLAKHYNE